MEWSDECLGVCMEDWLALPADCADKLLTAYVLYLFQHSAPLSHGTYTCAAVQLFRPGLRGSLKGAWRALSVWQRSEPTAMRAPLPSCALRGLVVIFLLEGWTSTAVVTWLAFHTMLRPDEAASLQRRHLTLPRDGALKRTGVVTLLGTKTANRGAKVQSVVIWDGELLRCLDSVFGHLDAGYLLCPGGLAQWRKRFVFGLRALGVVECRFSLASLRAGGATASFDDGLDLAEIQFRGRWDCAKTLAHYIQGANAALAYSRLPSQSLQTLRVLEPQFATLTSSLGRSSFAGAG